VDDDSPFTDAYAAFRPALFTVTGPSALTLGFRALRMLDKRLVPPEMITASAVSYTTYSDCTIFTGYGGDCAESCFGFEPHHMDPFYCATCAEQAADPANNPPWFWHFTGSRGSTQYKDAGTPCNGRDAWKWDVGACGSCSSSALYRCHDGYKKYPNAASWDPTICAGLISCDGTFKSCP
jgi:hypothetical protein